MILRQIRSTSSSIASASVFSSHTSAYRVFSRTMATTTTTAATAAAARKEVKFGPYEVSDQVFYQTSLVYALVNIKPILPGHVLVIPFRSVQRFTELTPAEGADMVGTVQKVQKMLASHYFGTGNAEEEGSGGEDGKGKGNGVVEEGSFNLAIQDGKESGQTVPHVHWHIIPRVKEKEGEVGEGDGIYDRLQGEEGNVGGGLWDRSQRPAMVGKFPAVDNEGRKPRSAEDMNAEATLYAELMKRVD